MEARFISSRAPAAQVRSSPLAPIRQAATPIARLACAGTRAVFSKKALLFARYRDNRHRATTAIVSKRETSEHHPTRKHCRNAANAKNPQGRSQPLSPSTRASCSWYPCQWTHGRFASTPLQDDAHSTHRGNAASSAITPARHAPSSSTNHISVRIAQHCITRFPRELPPKTGQNTAQNGLQRESKCE